METKLFNIKKLPSKKLRNVTQQIISVEPKKNKKIHLADVKVFAKKLDETGMKSKKYVIIGRNEYGTQTLRTQGDRWFDEVDDYYNSGEYDREVFDSFYKFNIIAVNAN
jgi:hypothetical protein